MMMLVLRWEGSLHSMLGIYAAACHGECVRIEMMKDDSVNGT